jgi:hypothetical protein
MENIALVVMEAGSEWPGHIGGFAQLMAFTMDEGANERVQQRIDDLQHAKHRVRAAVLACNRTTDRDARERRRRIASALFGAVAREAFGRLVLTACTGSSRELHDELMELAAALPLGRTSNPRATVSVRFAVRVPRSESVDMRDRQA